MRALVIFGPITRYLKHLDQFIPVHLRARISYVGIALMSGGAVLAFTCFGLFARGGGLNAQAAFPDPAVFISRGPYKYVRNPMAVGSLTFLAGWGLFERSPAVIILAVVMAGLMHLLVVYVEEPKLERRFGQSYRMNQLVPQPRGSFPRNFPRPCNSGIIKASGVI